jgi:hypothetical protein
MNVQELFDLKGKKAIVTGGGRGLGSFIAAGLAEAGADMVIASRKIQNLEKEAKELQSLGVKVRSSARSISWLTTRASPGELPPSISRSTNGIRCSTSTCGDCGSSSSRWRTS